ncbi:MAG TPA: serine/threonine-protein kinase [Pyrinomonadaceae bacterium]|jgi:serine/threonine-protein kinase
MAKSGDKIGPYTLVSKLGRGAFGVVWLAEKRTAITTTKVAIKIPNDEDVDLEAVKQEASLWVHASGHPNVLPIIDADIHDEQVIIVSEYAPDGSLSKWLDKHGGKAPSLESAIEMTLGILAGLQHLHERGIIHRDLKPDNILLQRETPRLADFGIARILKTTSRSTIATGTPSYMPPEAFDGKRSEQTDIWSVGVIFYQLLSGRLPFPQAEITALIGAIVTKEPLPLPDAIPAPVKKIVEKALQKSADARFNSAAQMNRALRGAASHLFYKDAEEEKAYAAPTIVAHLNAPSPSTPAPTEPLPSTPTPINSAETLKLTSSNAQPAGKAQPVAPYQSTGRKSFLILALLSLALLVGVFVAYRNTRESSGKNFDSSELNTNSSGKSLPKTQASASPSPIPTPSPTPEEIDLAGTTWTERDTSSGEVNVRGIEFKSGGKFYSIIYGEREDEEALGRWTQQGSSISVRWPSETPFHFSYKGAGTIDEDVMRLNLTFIDNQGGVANNERWVLRRTR